MSAVRRKRAAPDGAVGGLLDLEERLQSGGHTLAQHQLPLSDDVRARAEAARQAAARSAAAPREIRDELPSDLPGLAQDYAERRVSPCYAGRRSRSSRPPHRPGRQAAPHGPRNPRARPARGAS